MRNWLKDKAYTDHQPWNSSFAPGGSKYASPLLRYPARLMPDVILLRTVNGFWITWLRSSDSYMARRIGSPASSSFLPLEPLERSLCSSCTEVCPKSRTPGRRSPCLNTLGGCSRPRPPPSLPPSLPLTTQLLAALRAHLRTRLPLRSPRRDGAKTDILPDPCLIFTPLSSLWMRFNVVSSRSSFIHLLCMFSISG